MLKRVVVISIMLILCAASAVSFAAVSAKQPPVFENLLSIGNTLGCVACPVFFLTAGEQTGWVCGQTGQAGGEPQDPQDPDPPFGPIPKQPDIGSDMLGGEEGDPVPPPP